MCARHVDKTLDFTRQVDKTVINTHLNMCWKDMLPRHLKIQKDNFSSQDMCARHVDKTLDTFCSQDMLARQESTHISICVGKTCCQDI